MADKNDVPLGWAYFARNLNANQVWDLWWIGVRPDLHGRGFGSALLVEVETRIKAGGGRCLVIETSSLPKLQKTRDFYKSHGYSVSGEVVDFYADGDNKISFVKRFMSVC